MKKKKGLRDNYISTMNLPIHDENLLLSRSDMTTIHVVDEDGKIIPTFFSRENSSFSTICNDLFMKYMIKVIELTGGKGTGVNFRWYMSIGIDEKTNDCKLIFSPAGRKAVLVEYLGVGKNFPNIDMELVNKNLKKLSMVTTIEGLNDISVNLSNLYYNTSTRYKNINDFSRTISKFLKKMIEKDKELTKWTFSKPVVLPLENIDMKCFFLYVIESEINSIVTLLRVDDIKAAQIATIIVEKLIDIYEKRYPDDKTKIWYGSSQYKNQRPGQTHKSVAISYDIEKLKADFNDLIKESPLLKNVNLPERDKKLNYSSYYDNVRNYISHLLDDAIKNDRDNGAVVITDDDIDTKISQLKEEISSINLSEKDINLKKVILKKIQMVLIDIKPKTKQTGIGVFRNHFVYYYPNGMVAVDILDGYGALYVMPVHIYKQVKNKNTLREVRQVPGVKFITHKGSNWLEKAQEYLQNGVGDVTENDIVESSVVASIDFPYSLEGLEMLKAKLIEAGKMNGMIEKETTKRINHARKMKSIDNELSQSHNEDLSESLFNEEEDEIITSDKSFEELYEFWKKKHETGVRRNPVVAAITKRRACDCDGNYCCELCGEKAFEPSLFHSHHMIPLGEGGVDNIYNTVCLCPNCHSIVHSKRITLSQRAGLYEKIRQHLLDDAPEYIDTFDKMISPILQDENDNRNLETVNHFFDVQWNSKSK